MKTRDRIKAVAIEAFNEKGSTNVSTVQLSEIMGISPGNLYYYFENKEHIIRSIWQENIVPEGDAIYYREHSAAPHLAIFQLLEDLSNHGMKYRFFYTEIFTLLRNDPLLQAEYRDRWEQLVQHLAALLTQWENQNLLKTSTAGYKKTLSENLLLIGPATIHSSLALHPEMNTQDALRFSVVSACVILCGLLTDDTRLEMMNLLTENDYPVYYC